MDVWIINGIPSAGKSTTARALAQQYRRGVHIAGDRLQEFIVSGAALPGESPREEERRQLHLNVRNQCLLAMSFAQEAFTPVLDHVVVHRARLEEYLRELAGLVLRLVTLAPGVQTALGRDHQRPEKSVALRWTHLDAQIRGALQGVGLWVENSRLTVEETVAYIWSQREAARA